MLFMGYPSVWRDERMGEGRLNRHRIGSKRRSNEYSTSNMRCGYSRNHIGYQRNKY